MCSSFGWPCPRVSLPEIYHSKQGFLTIFSFYCMQNPASDRKMIKQEYGLFLKKISLAISLDNLKQNCQTLFGSPSCLLPCSSCLPGDYIIMIDFSRLPPDEWGHRDEEASCSRDTHQSNDFTRHTWCHWEDSGLNQSCYPSKQVMHCHIPVSPIFSIKVSICYGILTQPVSTLIDSGGPRQTTWRTALEAAIVRWLLWTDTR